MMMSQQMVLDMMKKLNLPMPHDGRAGPAVDNFTDRDFKRLVDIVDEECTEFKDNMSYLRESLGLVRRTEGEQGQNNVLHAWSEVIDAMCDIIVVVHNTACAMNLDLWPYFEEVHRTNMEKGDGPMREDGKRLKPPGWKPPRIEEMLKAELAEHKRLEEKVNRLDAQLRGDDVE